MGATTPGSLKYFIVLASGSRATAPETEAAYLVSGNSILAICGVNAAAIRQRKRA